MKDIKTNDYAIKVTSLWEANTDIQFIFDSYATANYYTSRLTKIDRIITNKFQTIILRM
jgi:hypothetical protein